MVRTMRLGIAMVVFASLSALAGHVQADTADATLFGLSADSEGWLLQYVDRYYIQPGIHETRDYSPFEPEGWADLTHYPAPPETDPAANGEGAFVLGLRLAGTADAANSEHCWTETAYIQSEDRYTHAQSGWPAGYEHHPDYSGDWMYGHHGSIGGVAGERLRLRLYNPSFAHADDPILATIYTRSGSGESYVAGLPAQLVRGWNVLDYPVSLIADPSDLRDVGVAVSADRHVNGDLYVDEVTLDDTTLDGRRLLYLSPDVAWFSESPGYDQTEVAIRYDDGGGLTPGVRGVHVEVLYPSDLVSATGVSPGDFLSGQENHFEYEIDEIGGRVSVDWVILGVTDGASGYGTLATIAFRAAPGQEGTDCCQALDIDESDLRLRDPDNNQLEGTPFDGQIAHDITPPEDPVLASTTHAEGVLTTANDVEVEWPAGSDGGVCPVGMRGYYLLIDQDPNGAPDPAGAGYSWFTPWSPDSTAYVHWFSDLPDGSWYVHIAGYDWLWNATSVDTYGPLLIDRTAPPNVTGLDADVTDNADLSVDLSWVNPSEDFAGVQIFRKGFGCYPEYDDDGCQAPVWPDSRENAVTQGWTLVYDSTASGFIDHPAVRDYYYYAAFVYDAGGNFSAAQPGARDASLCYWLGDFASGGPEVVDIWDVLVLSLCYNTEEGDADYNPICDIGPTIDYRRKSLPTTDSQIEFEDLIVLAMNYENARGLLTPADAELCCGHMTASLSLTPDGAGYVARVMLAGNPDCLIGASVQLSYGAGLRYVNGVAGDLWPDSDNLFFANETSPGVISLDAASLALPVSGDGCHAEVRFALRDPRAADLGVKIAGFRARGTGNQDLTGQDQADISSDTPRVRADVTTQTEFGLARLDISPNPVSRAATISFALASSDLVRIELFDATGRAVREVLHETREAGIHHVVWDGLAQDRSPAPPGIYFCRLATADRLITRKLLVAR